MTHFRGSFQKNKNSETRSKLSNLSILQFESIRKNETTSQTQKHESTMNFVHQESSVRFKYRSLIIKYKLLIIYLPLRSR